MPRRLGSIARRRPSTNTLESRMILHRFMCDQFGYKSLREMLRRLDDIPSGFMDGGASHFAMALASRISPHERTRVSGAMLSRYDENITAHSKTLEVTAARGKSWKPFQYLALLFTERYLDLYFQGLDGLAQRLNEWKRDHERWLSDMEDYTPAGLHTLAFQSATGSGKTLLLHANILQYRHYMKAYKRLHLLNKIILVTPDGGLSRQHLRELKASNIPAQLFSDHPGTNALSRRGFVVDIIDLHKLDEKKGIKRVALDAFEENNLVMVDEGHLGTGGRVWRKRRRQLAKNGFSFEYSATFNQAVSGSGNEIKELRDEYGKSILFDYSYRFFYEDGYGKDYRISNLQKSDDGEANNTYLLACLLMFYQQCRIYADQGGQWRDFNIAPPLWVFLGKTVTGGRSAGKKAIETDVIRIVNFLAWVQKERPRVVVIIGKLLSGKSGLLDNKGTDIFGKSFPCLSGKKPADLYKDMCALVFHGTGQVRVTHLTGTDELHLRTGDAMPFAVINVGDAAGLYERLGAVESPLFSRSKDAFNRPLFAEVDSHGSPVNIVIGARKFAAGWNSWRVSTMGLMHVGTGEGPQIIQMFGRGVRLKGHGMSLKRHTALKEVSAPDSEQLKLLETLNIFGLKANYMDKFKEYLQKEGIKVERVVFTLPTRKQFGKLKHLKTIKKQDGVGEFHHSKERVTLPGKSKISSSVELNRYSHLEVMESDGVKTDSNSSTRQYQRFNKTHLCLMNAQAIYERVLERKQLSSWHNMEISWETVKALLKPENQEWYTLYIPPEKLALSTYDRVREWEDLAGDLIIEYAAKYWRMEKNVWEHKHIEVAALDDDNPNYVEEYELSVDKREEELIRDIEQLQEDIKMDKYREIFDKDILSGQLSLLNPSFHAYRPLLHATPDSKNTIQISPVALNEGEAEFIKYLSITTYNRDRMDALRNKDIYLMRNLSRGRGISFFDDYSFYPDFILWLTDSDQQHLLFIDPKGLVHYEKSKVELHVKIKDTEKKMQKNHPKLFLSAYIWSQTKANDIRSEKLSEDQWHKKGVFFSGGHYPELCKMLEHALGTEHS